MSADSDARIRAEVRDHYRDAATTRHGSCAGDDRWGASRYDSDTLGDGSDAAVAMSMGCGNPFALADLIPGETVLDLGSGGGLDVILSARRVGPAGRAYGVDFLAEMVELARRHAADAGVDNVEFLEGSIEELPLPDASVDVVISNCVINLATDKSLVFGEVARVLRPGGRVAVFDVVAENGAAASDDGGEWADCGAGALTHDAYVGMLRGSGLVDVSIELTHQTGNRRHAGAIRARRELG